MKHYFTLVTLLSSMYLLSQVGVNTSNPRGTFHIDAGKDNSATGVPSANQQANDFILTSTGNVGLGTITPTQKLDINGKIKIVDGTQGEGKILTSDANGTAYWAPAIGTVTLVGQNLEANGIFVNPAPGTTAEYIINSPITLNKGTYTLYYYVQFDYYVPGSTTQLRRVDPTNADTFAATFPRYIYFDFVASSGAATFPSYSWQGTNNGPHVIPVINFCQVVSKVNQLAVITEDNTVIRPRYYGMPAWGRISGVSSIIAVKM